MSTVIDNRKARFDAPATVRDPDRIGVRPCAIRTYSKPTRGSRPPKLSVGTIVSGGTGSGGKSLGVGLQTLNAMVVKAAATSKFRVAMFAPLRKPKRGDRYVDLKCDRERRAHTAFRR